jgi:hypothetical protein
MKNRFIIILLTILLLQISTTNYLRAATNSIINPDSTKNGNFDKIKLTTLAFGGTGVLFTKVDNQLGVLTGGRGSATFNNRFTFGGAGWGMPKGIEIDTSADTLEFFKFGYGGLEFGYIFHEGQKVRFGSNLLVGCGVGFQEKYPKSRGEVNMFPVFEPTLYSQINLGKLLKLDIGLTYRFVTGSNFSFINNRQLSGPSIYIAFLAGTCNCSKID